MTAVQNYTHCEREDLLHYEVFDYLPGHSSIYKQWIKRQPQRYNWDRYVIAALIGVLTGFVGILMQEIFLSAVNLKWSHTAQYLQVCEDMFVVQHTRTHLTALFQDYQMSRYQKGKTNLDFTEARHSEWQWHQLGHMQVCTLLQTDYHASTPPLNFLQAGYPSRRPTNSVNALRASCIAT